MQEPASQLESHTGISCDHCRFAKRKCNRLRPCSACTRYGKTCEYSGRDKRKNETWQAALNESHDHLEHLREIAQQLRSGSTPEAISHLRQLRHDHALDEIQSPRSSKPESSENEHTAMPSELTTRTAIATFFERGEPLFHISTQDECEDLILKVYSSDNVATEADRCEISAIAALGCHYDSRFLPERSKARFIQRTSSNIHNLMSSQALQNMRCFLSLSLCFALEKSTTARSFTWFGLHIARMHLPKELPTQYPNLRTWMKWATVIRTLVTIECWLSVIFDYKLGTVNEELSMIDDLGTLEAQVLGEEPAVLSAVHAQLCKIASTSARTFSDCYFDTKSWLEVEEISEELDSWRQELPPHLILQPSVAPSAGLPSVDQRALLLIHVVYLESRLVPFQRKMQHCGILLMPENTLFIYTEFARQLAWLISIAYRDGRYVRCWLSLHACFLSSMMLLLSVCQNLLRQSGQETISNDLSKVQFGCDMLSSICDDEPSASYFVQLIIPFYHRVQSISLRLPLIPPQDQAAQMKLGAVLNHPMAFDPVPLTLLVGQIIDALRIPDHLGCP